MRTQELGDLQLSAASASLGHSFHAFVFVAYPLLIVVGTTAPAVPVDLAAITRCLAIAVAIQPRHRSRSSRNHRLVSEGCL